MAEEYGLSRTPVREALRRLEAEGLVVAQKNRGARVRPMSSTELVDLYGLRIRLESYAAELAAERATDDEIEDPGREVACFGEVRRGLAAADGTTPTGGGEGVGELDGVRRLNLANQAIHNRIVTSARHARLAAMLGRTVDIPWCSGRSACSAPTRSSGRICSTS